MALTTDFHMHSSYSGDSDTPMEQMASQALKAGLTQICFTEHMDYDYPTNEEIPEGYFEFNTDAYLFDLLRLREKYDGQLKILFGVELGLQPHLMRKLAVYAKSYEFDFIIGSTHVCHGKDPYYASFYEGRPEEEAYREYFTSTYESIKKFQNFDVYGHLDYVVRYGPNKDSEYSYEKYKDVIDPILSFLIEHEKGLEINTGGLKYGLRDVNPCADILKRYRELGGEIVTVGSDAHVPEYVGYRFDTAAEILKACGFKYYTTFEHRMPEFHKL